MPKISLIIPVYNEENYLKRCLESVLNQTKPFKEVIIIDDGSTDGSQKILEDYLSKFNIFYDVNHGVSHARNWGISLSHGDYITFLDSDDELLPNAHQIMLNAIQDNKDKNIIQFNHRRHYAKLHKTVRKYLNGEETFTVSNMAQCKCWYYVWNKVYKKSSIKHDFHEDISFGEDNIFNLEHVLDGEKIKTIYEETVIRHFENNKSLSKSKTYDQLDKLEQAYKKIMLKRYKLTEPIENIKLMIHCLDECQKIREVMAGTK